MNSDRPKTSWQVVLGGVLVALVVRLILLEPRETADGTRFRQQAESILAGTGYSTSSGPCTYLPPGYAYFLAGIFSVSRAPQFLIAVQLALSIFTCALMYFAILPRGRGFAAFGILAMALHLWSARYVGYDMSETFSTFLSGVLAWVISRIDSGSKRIEIIWACGILLIALPLTAPATIVVCYLLLGGLLYRFRSQPRQLVYLVAGILTLLVPWEIHCVCAGVGLQPTLLSKPAFLESSFLRWYRTWGTKESDLEVAWSPFRPEKLPRAVSASDEEYQGLLEARRAWDVPYLVDRQIITPEQGDAILQSSAMDEVFEQARISRIQRQPFFSLIGSPLIRAANLLLREPERGMWHRRPLPYGVGRVWWGLLAVGYALFSIAMIAIPACGLRARQAVPAAVFLGFVAYWAISSITGSTEARRNFPFLPLALATVCYLPVRRNIQSKTQSPLATSDPRRLSTYEPANPSIVRV